MKCKTLVLELTDYLDGELDPGLKEELELHLLKCKDCRLIVNTTKKTIEIYCNSDAAPLPEDARHRLQQAIKQKLQSYRRPVSQPEDGILGSR